MMTAEVTTRSLVAVHLDLTQQLISLHASSIKVHDQTAGKVATRNHPSIVVALIVHMVITSSHMMMLTTSLFNSKKHSL